MTHGVSRNTSSSPSHIRLNSRMRKPIYDTRLWAVFLGNAFHDPTHRAQFPGRGKVSEFYRAVVLNTYRLGFSYAGHIPVTVKPFYLPTKAVLQHVFMRYQDTP